MNREEILEMSESELLNLIREKYEIKIEGLDDKKYLSQVWAIIEKLNEKGWRIDIRAEKNSKKVDGIIIENGSPRTVFAKFRGRVPRFQSVTEGICRLALIIMVEK